jgi:hypothetical protein
MRISIFTRRPFTIIAAVATGALTLLIMAPRFVPRPGPHPTAMFPRGLPSGPHPQPMFRPPVAQVPAVRLPAAPVPAAPNPVTFNSSFSTQNVFGQFGFNRSTTLDGNSVSTTITRTAPFGSFNLNLNSMLSGSLNTALTLNRSLNLSETINGSTASFSTTRSFTLTAAQIASAIVAHQFRHAERAQLRQAQLATAMQGYGLPMTANPYTMPSSSPGMYGGFGMPSYGGSGYGGMGYGGGAQQQAAAPAVPGVQIGGNEAEREDRPVDHRLAALGVTNDEGQMLWPVGLRALPGERASQLRGEIDALLTRQKEGAAAGAARDLTAAVDALRAQLRRDKQERFSLTYQAYDDAEDYLAKLDKAAKLLGEAGTRELKSGKPAANK